MQASATNIMQSPVKISLTNPASISFVNRASAHQRFSISSYVSNRVDKARVALEIAEACRS